MAISSDSISKRETTFLQVEKNVSSNQKSAVKMNQSARNAFALLLAPLQSSFAEACRVSTSLH